MFDKFTDRARNVVVQASEESRTHHHDYIGTEHLLLGLIAERDDAVVEALRSLGVGPEAIRRQVEGTMAPGLGEVSGHVPFTPRAKTVLERSMHEAEVRGDGRVDAEHILCALSWEDESAATKALSTLGATPERVRQQVLLGWDKPSSQ
jgi:ATP-dependent Clp protease ATP-binding subunit ClpC